MPTVWTTELEHELLLVLLAYFVGTRPLNWGVIADALNNEITTSVPGGHLLTASALRQHVTKKMMKREGYSKLKEYFEMNNFANGNCKPGPGAVDSGVGKSECSL